MNATEAAAIIKNAVSMRECAERYGFRLNRAGFMCCPFHAENAPSLKCYEGNRGFSCYGCGERGSVIDFVQKLYGLTFWQAVTRINADFGLNIPLTRKMTVREQREAAKRAKTRQKAQQEWHAKAEILESNYDHALDYLIMVERIVAHSRPKTPDEPFSELYATAVRYLPEARDALNTIEIKRCLHERQRYSYCDPRMDGRRLSGHNAV